MAERKKYIQLRFHSCGKLFDLFIQRDLESFASFTKLFFLKIRIKAAHDRNKLLYFQIFGKATVGEHGSNLQFLLCAKIRGISAKHFHGSLIRADKPEHQLECRTLTGSVCPDQPDDSVLRNLHIQFQCKTAIFLSYMLQLH